MSAESVYDVIAVEARRYRKLATLRGHGSDMLDDQSAHQLGAGAVDLDDLLRRSLATGLNLHTELGRGSLPAGLVAEIRALAHPPLTWDVALARWFDEHFPAVSGNGPTRAPPAASPPRRTSPGRLAEPGGGRHGRRTFGVVLDTSGSMSTELLGKALGAIASYAVARDVPAARVVFCDAAAYDAGYLDAADIAGRVKVRGRGGTCSAGGGAARAGRRLPGGRARPGDHRRVHRRAPDPPLARVPGAGRRHAALRPEGACVPGLLTRRRPRTAGWTGGSPLTSSSRPAGLDAAAAGRRFRRWLTAAGPSS